MKKTKEYYQELLDLDFVKGEKLTKAEEEQHRASLKSGISVDNNIVEYGTSGTYRRINDEDLDDEALVKMFMFKALRRLNTIKNCQILFVVIAVIATILAIVAMI